MANTAEKMGPVSVVAPTLTPEERETQKLRGRRDGIAWVRDNMYEVSYKASKKEAIKRVRGKIAALPDADFWALAE